MSRRRLYGPVCGAAPHRPALERRLFEKTGDATFQGTHTKPSHRYLPILRQKDGKHYILSKTMIQERDQSPASLSERMAPDIENILVERSSVVPLVFEDGEIFMMRGSKGHAVRSIVIGFHTNGSWTGTAEGGSPADTMLIKQQDKWFMLQYQQFHSDDTCRRCVLWSDRLRSTGRVSAAGESTVRGTQRQQACCGQERRVVQVRSASFNQYG
jgi:hypothetical protein